MKQITIIGAGMSGFGAAYHLHQEGVANAMFDKNAYPGGHTASFKFDTGFIFDDGPHISFTKDERIQQLFAESVGLEYESFEAKFNNYWKGHWIKHPAQVNLHGLPSDLVVDILDEFVKAQFADHGEIKNYEDWLYASFGKKFADTFPMQYTRKYHTTDAANMTTDWLGPRLYRPDLKEVFHGAVSPHTADVHYISNFRYPTYGGFESYLNKFYKLTDYQLNHTVTAIDPEEKTITFEGGKVHAYEALISSIPLPALIPLIKNVPAEVVSATKKLSATQCVLVNIGIDRADLSDVHVSYYYDEDIFFTRLSFPHMFSKHVAPEGQGSIQAECYFSEKYKPLDRSVDDCIAPVIEGLKKSGVINDGDKITHQNAQFTPYAQIIYDHDRSAALEVIHGYLDEIGVGYCGRYGEWGYLWTDDSFKSGEKAAQKALEQISQTTK